MLLGVGIAQGSSSSNWQQNVSFSLKAILATNGPSTISSKTIIRLLSQKTATNVTATATNVVTLPEFPADAKLVLLTSIPSGGDFPTNSTFGVMYRNGKYPFFSDVSSFLYVTPRTNAPAVKLGLVVYEYDELVFNDFAGDSFEAGVVVAATEYDYRVGGADWGELAASVSGTVQGAGESRLGVDPQEYPLVVFGRLSVH